MIMKRAQTEPLYFIWQKVFTYILEIINCHRVHQSSWIIYSSYANHLSAHYYNGCKDRALFIPFCICWKIAQALSCFLASPDATCAHVVLLISFVLVSSLFLTWSESFFVASISVIERRCSYPYNRLWYIYREPSIAKFGHTLIWNSTRSAVWWQPRSTETNFLSKHFAGNFFSNSHLAAAADLCIPTAPGCSFFYNAVYWAE